jgi:hypothetical protein
MSRIYKECCVCHCPTYGRSKYCDVHRRAVHLEQKSSWEAQHRPKRKTVFDGCFSQQFTVIADPDEVKGFPPGAQLQGHDIRDLLEHGWMTPGAVLDCKGRRVVVMGEPLREQRLEVMAA